mgnify:CR=1 FL=1|jgi:hypothetical protein
MESILPKGLFVILLHQGKGPDHFDLILEGNDLCPTFQFESMPLKTGKRIKDHRKHYLNFEGEISPEKGVVSITIHGVYQFNFSQLYLISGSESNEFTYLPDHTLIAIHKNNI